MKLRIHAEKLLIVSQRFLGMPPFRSYSPGGWNSPLSVRQRLPATTEIAPGTTVGIRLRLLSLTSLGKALEIFVDRLSTTCQCG